MKTTELEAEFAQLYGPLFTYEEMACKCRSCGIDRMGDADTGQWFRAAEFKAFMIKLIGLRVYCAWPFRINSGYRCPGYNNEISSTGFDGPHTKGAADVSCAFERAYELIGEAIKRKLGYGPKQHGSVAERFVHVDNQGPRIWTYK